MDLLGLATKPIGLAWRVGETALHTAGGALRLAQTLLPIPGGGNGQDPSPAADDRWSVAAEPNGGGIATEPRPEPPAPEPVVQEPPGYDPAPLAPDLPDPVKTPEDEEAERHELVAEFAEEGAEDGAHAELHVDEPWEGYSQLKAAEVVRALEAANPVVVMAVQLYETANKNRRSVLQAAERRLATG